MKRILIFAFVMFFAELSFSQDKEQYNFKVGVNADYSFSGSTNSVVLGPSVFWEKEKDSEIVFIHSIYLDAGHSWSQNYKSSLVTSFGYYIGNLPGLLFGVSSQQYHSIETKNDKVGTDIRLSGEVSFAFFGIIGCRYQHPMIGKNEAQGVARHAIFVRIPIPVKAISMK
ncbi:MAG: hypothetical protein HKO81_00945 [Flavobacteriaceae bacterium]|nr:hypothetical protein [Flavobacteriaceae bacterium]